MNVEQLLELHRFRHPEMFSIWASYCFYMNPNGSHPCWYWWCAGHRSDSAALGVPYSEEWTCCEMTSDPWRKDLKPSQQQEILLSARGHENSLSGGSQTLPCHYSSMKMKEKKGRNHISHGWMYYIQGDEEKDDSISPDSCYDCFSHLQTAPVLQQPPVTSSTGLLQFIRESTHPAVISGEQFCPRDTHLLPMHIFLDEIPL